MPPRLNKRQQREQEELASLEASRLATAADPSSDENDEDQHDEDGEGITEEPIVPNSAVKSVFSAVSFGLQEFWGRWLLLMMVGLRSSSVKKMGRTTRTKKRSKSS